MRADSHPRQEVIAFMLGVAAAGPLWARQPAPFTEEAVARGVSYLVQENTNGTFGFGVAFADLDSDGDPDLVCVGRREGVVGVFENEGTGWFRDRSTGSGIPANRFNSAVSCGDYDRDGDLDVYMTVWTFPHALLRNDGNFSFTNVGAVAGIVHSGAGAGSAWTDFDGDGWPDVYVANRTGSFRVANPSQLATERNRLYRNRGDGTFQNVAPQHGLDVGTYSFQGTFFDMDRDADADLYVANDLGTLCQWRNRLWRNDAGRFIEISSGSGADLCMDAMCIAPGDFDGNGLQDLYITNTANNRLLLNNGDGTFMDGTLQAGVQSGLIGWGAVFFDFDNDGDLDLFVCNQTGPNRLYVNSPSWPCPDLAPVLGVADAGASSYCVAAADLDNDGDLDLAVASTGQPLHLYINHEGERRSWAKFKVRGRATDLWGIGARVDVRTGSLWQTREIIAGSGYKSQDDLVAHFGLGEASVIDEAQVTWRGGATTTLTGLAVNGTVLVEPPECTADFDGSGRVDTADFFGFLAAFQSGEVDFNRDGALNSQDFFDFLGAFFTPCG